MSERDGRVLERYGGGAIGEDVPPFDPADLSPNWAPWRLTLYPYWFPGYVPPKGPRT